MFMAMVKSSSEQFSQEILSYHHNVHNYDDDDGSAANSNVHGNVYGDG